MRRHQAAPLLWAAIAAAMLSASPAPGRALAQTAGDPTLIVPLHTPFLVVQTAATEAPSVRLLDAEGGLRLDVDRSRLARQDGGWVADLRRPGDDRPISPRPGDRVEVELGGVTTAVTVPAMTARADVAADTVAGTVPPGTLAAFVNAEGDAAWFDDPPRVEEVAAQLVAGGRFTADLAGRFDLRPGTSGMVVAYDGAHLFAVPFAPPSVVVTPAGYFAQVRADPDRPPTLAFRNAVGTDIFRSGPPIELGGSLFALVLAEGGVLENGVFDPRPGDRLVLLQEGAATVEATLPWHVASVDPAAGSVWGEAPPGSESRVVLYPEGEEAGAPSATARVTADDAGRFEAPFPAAAITRESTATVLTPFGDAVLGAAPGRVPVLSVPLFGNRIDGALPGWGDVAVEHLDAAGAPLARTTVTADRLGGIAVTLFADGAADTLAPGERLRLTPERGRVVDLAVPEVSARVDAGQRVLRGRAPAGASIASTVYAEEPDYFSPEPYLRPYGTLMTTAGADGSFVLRCASEACAMRYGALTASVAGLDIELQWLDVPLVGIGVTERTVIGRGTAGRPVAVTPYDAEGRAGQVIRDLVRPGFAAGLPALEIDLAAAYPDGVPVGARLRVEVGDSLHEATVPALEWTADVASNTVRGTGPRGRPLAAVALNVSDDPAREPAGIAQAVIGLDGRFTARFDDFDLKPGDDLDLYLPYNDHYLWWSEQSLRGTEPPPTATAVPRPPSLFVPYAAKP